MNKKVLTIVLSMILLVGILIIVVISNVRKPIGGRIMVSFPSGSSDIDYLSSDILEFFTEERGIENYVTILDSVTYSENLIDKLYKSYEGDLYYVVNNFNLNSTDYIEPTFNFEINDRSFKDLNKSFKTLSSNLGRFNYVPITQSPWGIYYNKQIFKKLGIDEVQTYSQLKIICSKIIDNDLTPFSMVEGIKWPFTSWFDYLSIRTFGSQFHKSLLSGEIDLTDERVKKIFIELFNIVNNNWFDINNSIEWKDMISSLVEGKTVMALSSTFFYENISNNQLDNIGWFPFPSINNEYHDEIVTSSGFITSEYTSNIDGVKDFLKFVLDSDTQLKIENNTFLHSVNQKLNYTNSRDDISKGARNISKSKNLIPSFERNTNPYFIIPLKLSLSELFKVTNIEDINEILETLESKRLEIQ